MSEYTDKIMKIFLNDKKEDNFEICIICGHKIYYDVEKYYDINGVTVCDACMSTVCEVKPIKDSEVICSQYEHCLSCPFSQMETGKECRLFTQKEIKEILNRKYGVLDEVKKA